ncbi:hypothetical protein B0O99DRAFT_702131 [Bisporella sp. PMI_857]|nr:hypothetical protein B0O99DRAFT_702131 [Bisporella sp. PMI_857]
MAKSKKSKKSAATATTGLTENDTVQLTSGLKNLNFQDNTYESEPEKEKKKKRGLKRNIVKEFAAYFGNESMLENWLMLCRDVGLETQGLTSIKKCRMALKKEVWVNIYDLIDANKLGQLPNRFVSEAALSKYTIRTNRIYPKRMAKDGGPVRALLAHIFAHGDI